MLFFRGLTALPLVLTLYALYLAVSGVEELLREGLLLFLPKESYRPGMGTLLAVAMVFAFGLLMYSWAIRQIYARVAGWVSRIPVVKTIYGMLTDVLRMFGKDGGKAFRRVVLVRSDQGTEQLGFVTRENFADLPSIGPNRVAVYLPLSYALGGFTVVVGEERIRDVPLTVDEALRFCVTAGVAKQPDAMAKSQ